MRGFGVPELLLVFGIVILLFGVGRISKIAGEMGKGIRAFRDGIKSNDEPINTEEKTSEKNQDQE